VHSIKNGLGSDFGALPLSIQLQTIQTQVVGFRIFAAGAAGDGVPKSDRERAAIVLPGGHRNVLRRRHMTHVGGTATLARWVSLSTIIVISATLLMSQGSSAAELKVITSGGFSSAYELLLPEFEHSTGIKVTTGSGASQGDGPKTIGAQLARGVPADVVILSREGLNGLIAAEHISVGTDVDLARTPTGVAVRAHAPKPDLGSVEAV